MPNLKYLRSVCKKLGFTLVEVDELSGFREHFVTGTDMSILLGVSPPNFGTPKEVIDAKIHKTPRPFRETRRMRLGSFIESFMMAEYIQDNAERLKGMGVVTVAYQQPLISVTLEAVATTDLTFWDQDGNLLLITEIKTTGEEVAIDEPPDRMKVQSAFQNWLGRQINGFGLFQVAPPESEIYIQKDLEPPRLFRVTRDPVLDQAFLEVCESMLAAKTLGDPSMVVLPSLEVRRDPGKPENPAIPDQAADRDDLDSILAHHETVAQEVGQLAKEANSEWEIIKKVLQEEGPIRTNRFILSGYYKKVSGGPKWKSLAQHLLAQAGKTEADFPDHVEPAQYQLLPKVTVITPTTTTPKD